MSKSKNVLESYDIEDRDLVRYLSMARVSIGAVTALMPRRAIRVWLGEPATPGLRHAARSLGARDVALGIGTLVALENGGDVSRWLEAQAMSDAADAAATLANFKQMPRRRRWLLLVAPVVAAILGLNLAGAFDED